MKSSQQTLNVDFLEVKFCLPSIHLKIFLYRIGDEKEEGIMGSTLACFNIHNQTEFSCKKLDGIRCHVLRVGQTKRNHYRGSLPNKINELTFKKNAPITTSHTTKLLSCMIMLIQVLRR